MVSAFYFSSTIALQWNCNICMRFIGNNSTFVVSYSIEGQCDKIILPNLQHPLKYTEKEGLQVFSEHETKQYMQLIQEERRKAFAELRYLPLFYLIPDEIAIKRKLADFPRDPNMVWLDKKWWEVYHSKHFQVMLLDTFGWMMWQSLGIRGGIDNYSKNDPFVQMVFSLPMWAWLVAEMGIHTDLLMSNAPGEEIPFLTMEQAVYNCEQIAKRFWNHPILKMKEVWEVVKKHRCHRDYSHQASHVKMDFHRQYYHTRAKTKTMPIIGAYGEDGEEEIIYAPYTPSEYAEVETRIWFQGFLDLLNEKDRKIVSLLEQGYTQDEIGMMLGYSNNSGVAKRIKHIRKMFEHFRRDDVDLLKEQHAQGKCKKAEAIK
jgi:hypothetical protein